MVIAEKEALKTRKAMEEQRQSNLEEAEQYASTLELRREEDKRKTVQDQRQAEEVQAMQVCEGQGWPCSPCFLLASGHSLFLP